MKQILTAIIGISVLVSVCYGAEKVELKDQKDRESYSLGYQFGTVLKMQGMDIDLDVYTSAIRDALAGKQPMMSSEEMESMVMGIRQKTAVAQRKAMMEQGEKNLAEGKAFLAENAKKQGVKTLPSGLQYKVLVEGKGKIPKKSDTVRVNYRGTLIDGTEFDSSVSRGQPANFKVDAVIRGWTEALQLMKEGAKWQLFIPAELAYGERGAPPRIPPQSTLIFEVELISVQG